MDNVLRVFSRPETLIFGIPLAAIVVGGILGIVKILIRHRERMAMIEHGLHPDHPPEEIEPAEDYPPGSEQPADTQPYVRE